ncbi:hypothetical protein CCM_06090 [Cordyceps militaris CM01]|uniref:Uncharacterized protein n=2 Tax=Cordyceps militaris TaxID=73501 RepID=G3JIN3_CORMM|nr:uncharacterized protein CCM_06090 [Cordyceps militaris CM01]ATY58894.1 hypothetical protein A9K55_003452 [Cordyceps militaris]EGX91930.1 hypothetical protein CCM_06090 [Cordyceps militaris CM01]
MLAKLLSAVLVLELVLASPVQDLQSLEKRCTAVGQSCRNGQTCCANSACAYTNSICTAFGSAGQYCGNAVPCQAGLACSTSAYCTPYGKKGAYCGNAVPCVSGLSCLWPSYTCG